MGARTKARKRALDVLFSSDVRGQDLSEAFEQEKKRALAQPDRRASWIYAAEIVEGIIRNKQTIDETIVKKNSSGWKIERMPAVDRAIMRIALWEILYNDKVPDAVAVSEALEAAHLFSTDESVKYINGVLSSILREK